MVGYLGCFAFNIAAGAARFTLLSSSRKRGSRGWLFYIRYHGRHNTFVFGYPFRPLQFAPLGLLEAAFIGYPRALVGRQPWIPATGLLLFAGMTTLSLRSVTPVKTGVHGWLSWLVVLHSISRKAQHVLLCCHPRASGDPEVGCFCIQYRGRRSTFVFWVSNSAATVRPVGAP